MLNSWITCQTVIMFSLSLSMVMGLIECDNGLFILQQMNLKTPQKSKIHPTQPEQLNPLNVHELIFEYKASLPFIQSSSQDYEMHPLVFKIMRSRHIDKIIVFVISEIDIYFLYKIEIGQEYLHQLSHFFQLSFKKLNDFVQFFSNLFIAIENQTKFGKIQIAKDYSKKSLIFSVIRLMGGKNYTVVVLKGEKQSQQLITQYAAYRYGSIQDRIHHKEQKINELKEMIRLKNPYLLKNFKSN